MNRFIGSTACVFLFSALGWAQEAQLEQAMSLEMQGQHQQAAQILLGIPVQYPTYDKKTQVLTKAGVNLEKANSLEQAHDAYHSAVSAKDSKHWEGEALLGKASVCTRLGCSDEARAAIERLKREFPDSTAALRASILEAHVLNRSTAEMDSLLQVEDQATSGYQAALQQASAKQYQAAITGLNTVLQLAPGAPVGLRALESRANILARLERYDEAFADYQQILQRLGTTAPQARIVMAAKKGLACVYHAKGNLDEETRRFEDLVANGTPEVASDAASQIAGRNFEVLQQAVQNKQSVARAQWEDVRARCRAVLAIDGGDPIRFARAELMLVETYVWEDRPEDTIREGQAFLEKYTDERKFKLEIATVRLAMAEDLDYLGRYSEALPHIRWVLNAYGSQREMWPGMDHVARAYYRLWKCLRKTGAPAEEISAAADALLTNFPESGFAGRVRFVQKAEGK